MWSTGRLRKSSDDVKEELRRSGLINSGDINGGNSASQSMELPDFPQSSSQQIPRGGGRPSANIYDGEMSVSNSLDIGGDVEVGAESPVCN